MSELFNRGQCRSIAFGMWSGGGAGCQVVVTVVGHWSLVGSFDVGFRSGISPFASRLSLELLF